MHCGLAHPPSQSKTLYRIDHPTSVLSHSGLGELDTALLMTSVRKPELKKTMRPGGQMSTYHNWLWFRGHKVNCDLRDEIIVGRTGHSMWMSSGRFLYPMRLRSRDSEAGVGSQGMSIELSISKELNPSQPLRWSPHSFVTESLSCQE